MSYNSSYNQSTPVEFQAMQPPLELAASVFAHKQQEFENNFKQIDNLKSSVMNLDLLNSTDKASLDEKNGLINNYFAKDNLDFTDPNTVKGAISNFDNILNDNSIRAGVQKSREWRNMQKMALDDLKDNKNFGSLNYDNFINGENGLSSYMNDKSDERNSKQVRTYTPAYDITKNIYDKCKDIHMSQHIFGGRPVLDNNDQRTGTVNNLMNEGVDPQQIEKCIRTNINSDVQAQAQFREIAEYNYRKMGTPEYLTQQYSQYNTNIDNNIESLKNDVKNLDDTITHEIALHGKTDASGIIKKATEQKIYSQDMAQQLFLRKKKDVDLTKPNFSDHYEVLYRNLTEESATEMGHAKAWNSTADVQAKDDVWQMLDNSGIEHAQLAINARKVELENIKESLKLQYGGDLPEILAGNPNDPLYELGARELGGRTANDLILKNTNEQKNNTNSLYEAIDNLSGMGKRIDGINADKTLNDNQKAKSIQDLRFGLIKNLDDHYKDPIANPLTKEVAANAELIGRYERGKALEQQTTYLYQLKDKIEAPVKNNSEFGILKDKTGQITDPSKTPIWENGHPFSNWTQTGNPALLVQSLIGKYPEINSMLSGHITPENILKNVQILRENTYHKYLNAINEAHAKDPTLTKELGFHPFNDSHSEKNVDGEVVRSATQAGLGEMLKGTPLETFINSSDDFNIDATRKGGDVVLKFSEDFYKKFGKDHHVELPPDFVYKDPNTGKLITVKIDGDTHRYPPIIVNILKNKEDNLVETDLDIMQSLGLKSGYETKFHSEVFGDKVYTINIKKQGDMYLPTWSINDQEFALPLTGTVDQIIPRIKYEIKLDEARKLQEQSKTKTN